MQLVSAHFFREKEVHDELMGKYRLNIDSIDDFDDIEIIH